MLACLLPLAYADGKLSITNVKIYVDGDKDSGTIDVKPESTVKVKFKVENTYSDSDLDKSEIEDIEATVTIEGIDDGDDIDDEADVDDLKVGKDDSVTITLDLPLELDHDDDYILKISITGEDAENSSITHTVEEEYDVRVKKEKHDLLFKKAELTNSNLKCSRTTSLSTYILNMGEEEEDEVKLTITNAELELNKQVTFDLSDDPFDDDSKYRSTIPITIAQETEPGVYPIIVRVEYDEGDEVKEKTVELTVTECVTAKPKEEPEEEETTTIIVQEPTTPITPVVTQPIVTTQPEPETKEKSFFSTPLFIGLIVGFDLLIVLVGIVLIVSLSRKKS